MGSVCVCPVAAAVAGAADAAATVMTAVTTTSITATEAPLTTSWFPFYSHEAVRTRAQSFESTRRPFFYSLEGLMALMAWTMLGSSMATWGRCDEHLARFDIPVQVGFPNVRKNMVRWHKS